MEIKKDFVTIVTTEDAIRIAQSNLIKINEIIVNLGEKKKKLEQELEQCKIDYDKELLELKQKYKDKHNDLKEEIEYVVEYIEDHKRVLETTQNHLKQFQEELKNKSKG